MNIIELARKYLPADKQHMIQQAKELMKSTSNPIEALQKAGVTSDLIDKAKGYLNNPLANKICESLAINKTEVMNLLDNFSKGTSTTTSSPVTSSSSDDLEKLSRTLHSLKNKQ